MTPRATPGAGRRRRHFIGGSAVVVALVIGASACGVKAGTDAAFLAAGHGPVTTTAPGGGSTTAPSSGAPSDTTTPLAGTPTAPSTTTPSGPAPTTPDGYQLVGRTGLRVTFEVPLTWVASDVDAKNLTAAQSQLLAENPALAGLLSQGTGMYSGAVMEAAVGPVDVSGAQTAFAAQLGLNPPSLPDFFGQALKLQLENSGATNVTTASVSVTGLPPDQKALRIDLTIAIGGHNVTMHELLVPTSDGLVVVAVRADDPVGERILASVVVH